MASVRTRAAVGGLLAGFGRGLVDKANQQREDALAQLRRQQQIEDREDDQRESRGLLTSVVTDENRNAIGVTRSGGQVNLGIRMPPERTTSRSGADETGMTAGDQRLWNTIVERHTTAAGLTGEDSIDWTAVATDLRDQGRPDLAKLAQSSASQGTTIDTNSEQWLQAEQLADQWIKDQTTVLGRDRDELADYGGNRTQARLAKTQEFYAQLTGQAPSSSGQSAARSGTVDMPSGSGSRNDPYRATTQAHIDWFRESAPAGSVIEADGTLYVK